MIVICLVSPGCKSKNPTPELADPIFNDLEIERKGFNAAYEAEKKENADIRAKMAKPEQKFEDLRQLKKELDISRRKLVDLDQKRQYYEVRVEQRRQFALEDYDRAFEADKPWPRPEDHAEYKAIKRLQLAPRSWDARVPKLTRHLKPDPKIAAKEEKPAPAAH